MGDEIRKAVYRLTHLDQRSRAYLIETGNPSGARIGSIDLSVGCCQGQAGDNARELLDLPEIGAY